MKAVQVAIILSWGFLVYDPYHHNQLVQVGPFQEYAVCEKHREVIEAKLSHFPKNW